MLISGPVVENYGHGGVDDGDEKDGNRQNPSL